MLKLNEQIAKVSNVNIRCEKHGDDDVTGCDINIHFETGAKILDSFDKSLRAALYVESEKNSRQGRVAGTGKEDALDGPQYQFAGTLGELPIKKEWPGYKVGIQWGDIASTVDIELGGVKVTKIKAEPKDGGSCGIKLQMQCHPKKEDYGDLALLLNKDVKLTMTPPTVAELKKIEKEEAKKNEGGDPSEE